MITKSVIVNYDTEEEMRWVYQNLNIRTDDIIKIDSIYYIVKGTVVDLDMNTLIIMVKQRK